MLDTARVREAAVAEVVAEQARDTQAYREAVRDALRTGKVPPTVDTVLARARVENARLDAGQAALALCDRVEDVVARVACRRRDLSAWIAEQYAAVIPGTAAMAEADLLTRPVRTLRERLSEPGNLLVHVRALRAEVRSAWAGEFFDAPGGSPMPADGVAA